MATLSLIGLILLGIPRNEVIDTAWAHASVTWVCDSINAAPVPECPDWYSDYQVGQTYVGMAYEWGGWDTTPLFLTNLANGLRAGAHSDNDCIPWGDPPWATGEDCSGLVSRAWQLPYKHSTSMFPGICDTIPFDSLQPGDILDWPGHHSVIFHRWLNNARTHLYVFQSTDRRPGPSTTGHDARPRSAYAQYIALRYHGIEPAVTERPETSRSQLHFSAFPEGQTVVLHFSRPLPQEAHLSCYDPSGRLRERLTLPAHVRMYRWSPSLPDGIYFLRLEIGSKGSAWHTLLLLR